MKATETKKIALVERKRARFLKDFAVISYSS
jgi:hypothetical protein